MQADHLEQEILDTIQLPEIPDRALDIRQCGAVPGTDTLQTAAIQQAIDTLAATGGGRVVVPEGCFLTGALRLRSHVELHLQTPGSILRFTPRVDTGAYPIVFSHWEGTPCYNFSALLYACDETDLAVTGPGQLDGQGRPDTWWAWQHQEEDLWSEHRVNLQGPASQRLRTMNENGVPVEQRRFGPGDYLRPNFLQFLRCERVLLDGFTMRNSPMWNLNPVHCRSVTVRGVSVLSHGPNSDGCDPESCCGVLIEDCRFDNGDDCISLKSGRDRDGRLAKAPCCNVVIRHNTFADGHGGIALGSEMSGGLCRIVARHNRFDSPNLTYALRLKSNARRGGVVEQVVLADSDIRRIRGAAVHGTMMYEDGPNGDTLPVFRDILIENITAHGGEYGLFLEAFPEVPITGLVLRHIHIDGVKHAMQAANWQEPVVEDVVINGEAYPRPYAVRVLGIPAPGAVLQADSRCCVPGQPVRYQWLFRAPGGAWQPLETGPTLSIPTTLHTGQLKLQATLEENRRAESLCYRLVAPPTPGAAPGMPGSAEARRLETRGLGLPPEPEGPITRAVLAGMLGPLLHPAPGLSPLQASLEQGVLALQGGAPAPEGPITREEMATMAMACCGVSYHNASTTTPVCADAGQVASVHATQVARALYFGFMQLDDHTCFAPRRLVTGFEAVQILDRVADFAGL